MAKRNERQALLVGVGVIAFTLGRCSAGDAEPESATPPAPQALFQEPTEAPAADTVPEAVAAVAEPDPIPEPDVAPMPLVSHAPSRSHGGRAFANCSEARAAGAAPVYAGDPGYAPRLDRDGDGVGCE